MNPMEETTQAAEENTSSMPDWLTELINRLIAVFTKVLAKLGLKLIF